MRLRRHLAPLLLGGACCAAPAAAPTAAAELSSLASLTDEAAGTAGGAMAATVECVRLHDAVVCDGEVFRRAGAAAHRRRSLTTQTARSNLPTWQQKRRR